jgi:hypothetical protein
MNDSIMNFTISNVEAMYPKINRTYKFDSTEQRSIPCDAMDAGAEYNMRFRMDKDQAKALYEAMAKAYADKKEANWAPKLAFPFKKEEDGTYTHKTKLKGAYGVEATRKPTQFDSNGVKLNDDFLLTTGSVVNIAVTFKPYKMNQDAGVSLRLKAVQVVKYKPMEENSPFGVVEGGYQAKEVKDDNPFETVEEPIAEPKKVEPKKATKEKVEDNDLSAIVDNWDD